MSEEKQTTLKEDLTGCLKGSLALFGGIFIFMLAITYLGSGSSSSGGTSSGSYYSKSKNCYECNTSMSSGYYTLGGEIYSTSDHTILSYCSRSCARKNISPRWR